ncbi:MAG: SRPBCC family protein [Bacteroidota bacterium]
MNIDKTIQIDAPAARVWDILGHRFHDAGLWASAIAHSAPREAGPIAGDAPFDQNGRACDTTLGPFRETLQHYDEQAMRYGYTAEGDTMPFFVKRLQNNWTVRAEGPRRTTVVMEMEAQLLPVFAQLMGPLMKRQFDKVLTETTEELKYYIEHDRPHPRKVAAMQHA